MQEKLFTQQNPREFSIPIMPHLKKFVLKNYKEREPVKVEEKNMLGRCIMAVLQDTRRENADMNTISGYHGNTAARDPLRERLRVVLNSDMMDRSPRINKLLKVNIQLKSVFKESLIIWVEAQRKMGVPPNSSVKLFLEHYSIEEHEFSYEGAWKIWDRYKNPPIAKSKRKKQKVA